MSEAWLVIGSPGAPDAQLLHLPSVGSIQIEREAVQDYSTFGSWTAYQPADSFTLTIEADRAVLTDLPPGWVPPTEDRNEQHEFDKPDSFAVDGCSGECCRGVR